MVVGFDYKKTLYRERKEVKQKKMAKIYEEASLLDEFDGGSDCSDDDPDMDFNEWLGGDYRYEFKKGGRKCQRRKRRLATA